MRDSDIHVGDVLKVKMWEDMSHEYVIDECGNVVIPNEYRFTTAMKHLCGKALTVKEKRVTAKGCMRYYSIENVEEFDGECAWVITAGMLEPFEDDTDEFDVATDEEIKLLFG